MQLAADCGWFDTGLELLNLGFDWVIRSICFGSAPVAAVGRAVFLSDHSLILIDLENSPEPGGRHNDSFPISLARDFTPLHRFITLVSADTERARGVRDARGGV